jgi:putative DNA primase/helicase
MQDVVELPAVDISSPSLLPPTYPLTDCGNAERLIDQHGDCIRFCPPKRQWFVWNGCKWTADEGAAIQLVKKTVRAIRHERMQAVRQAEYDQGASEVLRRQADALAKWANRSEGATQIAATLRMSESDPRVSTNPDDFDRDPLLLNLTNGVIDLSLSKFREHRPGDLLTKVAGAEYKPDAICPRWLKFLEEVFEPHPDVIPYVQRAVGYTLTGKSEEECVFALVGSGRNGKSTLIAILHQLLGEYGGVAEMDTFLGSGASKLREDLADMRGRRFVSAQEPFMNSTFAEATLKWVSGGDRLRARRLYEHAQEFQPTHKLWFAMNRMPALRSDDHAAWSRLRVIPFDVSFAKKPDRELKTELRSELSGVLNWALEGCGQWQRHGLWTPRSVENATEGWRTYGSGRKRQTAQT